MRPVVKISFVLVFLVTGVQSRPLVELESNGHPTDTQCPPPRCLHKSKCYANGEEMSRRSDGSGGCHGLLCSHGQSVAWDDFNCGQATTVPSTTSAPSTTPSISSPTTFPLGCFQKGIWYPPNSDISRGSDGNGWCYGEYCDQNGHVVTWDDWDCGSVTTTEIPSSASPPTPAPTPSTPATPTPPGCLQNGISYPPGSEISRKSNGNGWCYGQYCDENGLVVVWDDWTCGQMAITETSSATPSPNHTPTPTPSTAPTPLGCLQNGVWYPAGSEISRGTNGKGWCFGVFCTHDSSLQLWDDFNCKTSPPTTPPTTSPKGCYYEGQWHPTGIFEGTDARGCRYGAQCGLDGQVTRWEEFDCRL